MIKLRHRFRNKKIFIVSLICMLLLTAFTLFVPPTETWTYLGFFFLLAMSIFFFFYFVFANRLRAILLTTGITVYMVLRIFQLRHWLYPLLIVALIICIEVYVHTKNAPPKREHAIPKL